MGGFGGLLKKFRTKRGWSQDKLAEISGISKNSISEIELGKRGSVSLETVLVLSKALEIKASELIGEEKNEITTEAVVEFLKAREISKDEATLLEKFRSAEYPRQLLVLYVLSQDRSIMERLLRHRRETNPRGQDKLLAEILQGLIPPKK